MTPRTPAAPRHAPARAGAARLDPRAAAPVTLARHELLGALWSGPDEVVHLARERGAHGASSLVALHESRLEGTTTSALARAAREVREGASVLAATEVLHAGGRVWHARPHRPGLVLAAALARGERPSVGVALRVVTDALEALHALHAALESTRAGAHLDLRPASLHVGLDGVTRVIDLGVGRALHGPRREGWRGCEAPELRQGVEGDRRADVFSAAMVLRASLEDVATLPDDELDALEAMVARACADDPARRFASALEFAEELRGVFAPRMAGRAEVIDWVRAASGDAPLRQRALERAFSDGPFSVPPQPAELAADTEVQRGPHSWRPAPIAASQPEHGAVSVSLSPPRMPASPSSARDEAEEADHAEEAPTRQWAALTQHPTPRGPDWARLAVAAVVGAGFGVALLAVSAR